MRIGSISFLGVLCLACSVVFCPVNTELFGHMLCVECLCLCARWNGIKNKFAINSFIFLCFAHKRKKIIIIVLFAPQTLHRRLTFFHRPARTFPLNSFSVPRDAGSSLSSAPHHQYKQLAGGVDVLECAMELEKVEQQRNG